MKLLRKQENHDRKVIIMSNCVVYEKRQKTTTNLCLLFYEQGSTVSRLQSKYEETVFFLPLRHQKFLVLIWSTSEGWQAESTLVPLRGFELETPGLGIQCLNHHCRILEIIKINGTMIQEIAFLKAGIYYNYLNTCTHCK